MATAGRALLLDIRPANLVKEPDVAAFAAASAGRRYLVVTGWRGGVTGTVEALACARRPGTNSLGLEEQLLAAAVGPRRFGELVEATSRPVPTRSHLLRLLWRRRLAFELVGPLGDDTTPGSTRWRHDSRSR
ncbi:MULTISPECIES: hypothetical protein [unclassified Streptomyces]|uniref:hypothetical protein n=1 Tax=unclassified Streptomyces TaxID=2593676 RepID=UPI0036F502DE